MARKSKKDEVSAVTSLPEGTATDAIADIMAYEKEYEGWIRRGKLIIERYRDERTDTMGVKIMMRKFNVLWSNVETTKPTLYARAPRIQVERRFKDADPVGRTASEIAERMGNYLVETTALDQVMRACVHDRLLPGRAVAWVNYSADLAEVAEGEDESPAEEYAEGEGPEPELEKIHETVEPSYVDWKDFGHQPKRTWTDVNRAWRKVYLKRKQLVERFGEELGNKIELDHRAKDEKGQTDDILDQATIYEVWDKKRRKVCWVNKAHQDYLDETDPPVEVQGFWPFPKPLFATLTNDTLIPVPDYALYQDQAAELDKITNRIGRLTDALKVVGVCDASVPELQRLLSPNGTADNTLIQVPNWQKLVEKGGMKGAVDLIDLAPIAAALLQLYSARDQVLNVIYQVTGLADIIRGASNPNETATAQSIKGQYAGLRIRDTQAEVARFCRDTCRIMVEIGVEMFEPQLIYEMVQAKQFCKPTPAEQQQAQLMQQFGLPPPPAMEEFNTAMRMLRDDKLRSFHIDIETDSTIALNEQEDKQSVTEFIAATGQFLGTFGPIIQQQPALAPVAGEMLLYASRRFKAGRAVEASIEKAVEQIVASASQPKPNPEMVKAEQDAKLKQAEMQQKAQATQQDMGLKAQKQQGELTLKAQGQQADIALKQQEMQMDRRENVVELRLG